MDANLIVDRREYPLGNVKSADVKLQIRHGSLAVRGGAQEFCSAMFEYSHEELKPLDDYDSDDDEAELEISQPSTNNLQNPRNTWNLAFNSAVTVSMAIESMSGAVNLNLDDVKLADLEVKSRSGVVKMDLGGSYPELDEILIDSTSGSVNGKLSGDCPTLTSIDVESKSGRTALEITGSCPELRRLAVASMSGNVDLDLRGAFQRDDLGVRIDCKSGNVRVRLPEGVGASMNASTISGKVRADGFSSLSGRRTNSAFERSTATIWLNIHVISGNVSIVSD